MDAIGENISEMSCFVVPTNIPVFICNSLQGESEIEEASEGLPLVGRRAPKQVLPSELVGIWLR